MTTSPNVLVYAALDGWRRQMVQHGHEILGAALDLADHARTEIGRIPDLAVMEDELLGEEASHDLDRLQVLIDLSGTGRSGYQAADWVRENCHIDIGLSDHRRILATLSFADTEASVARLIKALSEFRAAADGLPVPPPIALPSPEDLQLETVALPRDAFFGPAEMVDADHAAGRIAAEQVTPYPPGIPAVVPGERITQEVIDYLRTGAEAGMTLPDAADSSAQRFRVVA
jgi:arginine/lysine/ornithine decarboxylase